MATNFVQPGRIVTFTTTAATAAGDVVKAGTMIGVAANTAAIGEALDLELEGVWELPKVSADAITLGAAVYWDATAKLITTTSTSNTKIGVAVAAAGASTGSVKVRLNGSF